MDNLFYNEEQIILKKLNDLQNDLNIIRELKKKYPVSKPNSSLIPFNELTWIDKVLFVLKEENTGFVTEITNKIIFLLPILNPKTTKNAVRNKLSILYLKKVIDADKIGKKYKYKMKEA